MIRGDIVNALAQLGVEASMLSAMPDLPPDARGLLVYGSQARGDAVEGSDLDLLALVDVPRPSVQADEINVSFYTPEQLATGVGSLFGAHLRRDAKVIWDPEGLLGPAVHKMGDVDAERLLHRAREMSTLFTTPEWDQPKYLAGLLREARYLLRSCLYAEAISTGRPCFSVRELAARHNDAALVELLSSHRTSEPSESDLRECLIRLRSIVGEFPVNPHGSLEATIVNEWDQPGDLLSMAFLALGTTGRGSDYAEVEKILL